MKICGIVAEYNPLHKGHKYLIDTAKKDTDCDYIVIVMSGDYVQRGEPAIINKYSRTRMALLSGADAVFMLPSMLSTGSAQYFARGAVGLLSAIGVDYIYFGSESGQIDELSKSEYIKGSLNMPNDILGREYIKAIADLDLNIKPMTTKRLGSDYNDHSSITDGFCSASYIRQNISHISKLDKDIMPSYCLDILLYEANAGRLVFPNDISDILFSRLIEHYTYRYNNYFDVFNDLSDKIAANLTAFTTYTDFIMALKSKDITYSHLSRALLHIALSITNEQIDTIRECNYVPYLRLLGFKKESSALISYINKISSQPVINSLKEYANDLPASIKKVFDTDVNASHIYSYMQNKKTAPFKHEYAQPLIII